MSARFWKWLHAKDAEWTRAMNEPAPELGSLSKKARRKVLERCRFTPRWLYGLFFVALGLCVPMEFTSVQRFLSRWAPLPVMLLVTRLSYLGVGLTIMIVTIVRRRRAIRAELRRRPCWECGYSLIGLTEPRCPECGTEFEPAQYERIDAMLEPMAEEGQPEQSPTDRPGGPV